MERNLNNRNVLEYGDFNDNQIFFIQRWIELLNTHTHSKYAVRYLNTHQALKELNYVIKEMIEGSIKRNDNHLSIVFEEVNKVLTEDEIFKNKAPSHSRILDNSLRKAPKAENVSKLYSIIFRIEYVIRHIEKKYLGWIIEELNNYLFNSEQQYKKIEKTMELLASELLGKGWSIDELYSTSFDLILTHKNNVNDKFNAFFSKLRREPLPYIFIFSIRKNLTRDTRDYLEKLNLEILTGEEILNTYSDYKIENIDKRKYYVRVIQNSLDVHSGVNSAWQTIVSKLDVLNFYGYIIPDFDIAPIILLPDTPKYVRNVKVDLVTKKRRFKAPDTLMDRVLKQLNNGNVEVNRKLKSLFEFIRISDESLSPQSTFINLWIGIESFVQSKEFDGSIENVKMVISTTATHNYIYSLVKNFLEDCNRCELAVNFEGRTYIVGKLNPKDALELFWNDNFVSEMTLETEKLNILLAYRFKEMYEMLKNGRRCASILENHMKNLQQHVHRLYRIRNSIVHAGQVQYNNTDLFIRHLYEYIEYVMSVVIHRLEEDATATLEQIFAQVRDSINAKIEILNNSKLLDQETYFNLILKGAF